MFPPQSTLSKRRVESYRIYKRPYNACSQSSRPSPSSYEKATDGKLVGLTLSTPRGDEYYNQYRPLSQKASQFIGMFSSPKTIYSNKPLLKEETASSQTPPPPKKNKTKKPVLKLEKQTPSKMKRSDLKRITDSCNTFLSTLDTKV